MSLALAPIQPATAPTSTEPELQLLPPTDPLQTDSVDEFARKVKNIIDGLWKQWRPEHFRFTRNALFCEGRHWLSQLNDNLVDYTMMNREAAKTLVTDNQIEDIANRLVSRVVQRRMEYRVKEASQNEDDLQRAKTDNKLLTWVFEDQRMRLVNEEFAGYVIKLSSGYISHWFDEERTKVRTEVGDPSSIMFPMWSKLDNEIGARPIAPYVARVRRMYRPVAEREYGRKFTPTQPITNDGRGYFKYLFEAEQRESADNDIVIIVELWVHPKYGPLDPKDNPRGLIYTIDLNDQGPFSVREWPYPYAGYVEGCTDDKTEQPHYPWARLCYRETPQTARSRGVVEMLYEDQMHLNRTQTQILWWQNIACAPILIRPEGSIRKDVAPIIRSGKIWDVNMREGIPAPFYMQPPPLNTAIFQKPEVLKQSMREKAASIEAQIMSGDTSGVALAQKKASDDQNHAPFMTRFMGIFAWGAKDILKIIKCYFPPTFTAEIFGRKTAGEDAEVFSTQQIDTSLDVISVGDEYGYESVAMRDQRIDNMVDKGQISPAEALARKEGREPDEDKINDMECAVKENDQMLRLQPIVNPPILAQNNDVHLEQHGALIRSWAFYRYDPRIQQLLLSHYSLHLQRKQQMDAEQAANLGSGMQSAQAARGRAEPQVSKPGIDNAMNRARKELTQPGVTDIQTSINRSVADASAKNQVAQERNA